MTTTATLTVSEVQARAVQVRELGARVAECLESENSSPMAAQYVAARAWAAASRAMFRCVLAGGVS